MDNATDVLAALKAGKTTQQEMLGSLSARRQAVEPHIKAFIHICDPVAPASIETPLAGLAITVKDQIHVAGMPCTFGVKERRPPVPENTASAVQRLVDAGATVIGKTSLPPFAMDFQTSNDLVGTTNNPWNLAYTAGGSSGGGAAAVASGMSLADIGADLAGSLRIPASFCGVFSLLPGAGALSGDGMLKKEGAQLRHFARIGPIGRSVDDLALLWAHMSQTVQPAVQDDNRQIRLAVSDGASVMPVESRVRQVFGDAIGAFSASDVNVTSALPENLLVYASWSAYGTIMGHETGALMNPVQRFLARIFGRSAARQSPRFLAPVHNGYRRNKAAYRHALDRQAMVTRDLEAFLDAYDALLLPVCCVGAFEHREPGSVTGPVRNYTEPFDIDGKPVSYLDALTSFATPVSLAGNPVVTMPLGLDRLGLPVGAQLVGKTGHEWQLLDVARRLSGMLPRITAPDLVTK
ncbi:amidase [Hoeflea prorocentri]|uniref:Amidase n=1 Tax=Hoeflea prorocentri TaxID=1922333 RepID=A0A9X3ZJY0_9HYPH|nr:amidase [Hoeflea prorocentri]MCY6383280.1 amidase [Hoeflea prorocentri]MDA5401080.1 amidase [Hoeflea prorocentri]